MARVAVVVGLLVLVVAAGCLTAEPAGTSPAETTERTVPFEMPDRTVDRVQNPWDAEPIEVVVETPEGVETDIHPEVMRTLTYWENRIDPRQRYQPEFQLVSQSDDPDVRVQVVQAVDGCGVHQDSVVLGCAPIVPENAAVTDDATVQVRAGQSPETARAILKHEVGHLLGYEHGEGPGNVMAENLSARAPDNMTDAVDRPYPWASETLRVAVVAEDGTPGVARERVRRALDYYERGADGAVTSPPTFVMVFEPADADIVVELRDSVTDCDHSGQEASCARWDGPDVDDDGEPEYLTDAHIVLGSDGRQYAGWHVGYWLGWSMGSGGVPDPFLSNEPEPAEDW